VTRHGGPLSEAAYNPFEPGVTNHTPGLKTQNPHQAARKQFRAVFLHSSSAAQPYVVHASA